MREKRPKGDDSPAIRWLDPPSQTFYGPAACHFSGYYFKKGKNWPLQRSVLKLVLTVRVLSQTRLRIERDPSSEAASENNTVWGKVSFVWCWVVRRVRKNKGLQAGLEAQLGICPELLDRQGQEAGQRQFDSSSLGITATMRKWMNTGRLAPFLACSANTLGEKGPWRASKTQYSLNFAPSCHKLSTYSVLAIKDTGMSKRKTGPVPEDIIKTTATKATNREIKTRPDRRDCELCTKCCQKRGGEGYLSWVLKDE